MPPCFGTHTQCWLDTGWNVASTFWLQSTSLDTSPFRHIPQFATSNTRSMAQRQLQSFLREHNDANAEHDEANAGITLGGLGSCSDSSQPTDVRNPKRVSRSRSPAAVRLRALTVLRREMGVPISEKSTNSALMHGLTSSKRSSQRVRSVGVDSSATVPQTRRSQAALACPQVSRSACSCTKLIVS